MKPAMPLVDAIFQIAQFGEDAVICAKEPFVRGSDSVIAKFDSEYRIPDDIAKAGYSYFLGRDDVVELLEMIAVKRASRDTKADFVCHYAAVDAYPAWFDDLPNEQNTKA